MVRGLRPAAVRSAARRFYRIPGTAPHDFEAAGIRPRRVGLRSFGIRAEPVFTPFLYISAHVVASKWARTVERVRGLTVEIPDRGGQGVRGHADSPKRVVELVIPLLLRDGIRR